jgi:hypothetical protein
MNATAQSEAAAPAPTSLIATAAPAPEAAPAPVEPGPSPELEAATAALAPLTDETFSAALPEGFAVEDESKAALLEAINSGTSRSEIAKNLLGLYSAEVEKFQTAQTEVWNNVQTQWQNEIKSDPAFAGDKLERALADAHSVALQLGGKDFVNMLDATGMGNNIHALRALLKAKELIPQEGQPVGGRPAAQPKSLAEKLFGAK